MFIAKPPKVVTKILHNFVWRIPTTDKTLFLTFDDGPVPETTSWVLKTLENYNAKATFFCVGNNILKYPNLHHSIINNGHIVGNHTFDHVQGWQTPYLSYLRNVQKANLLINSPLFRPPHGKITYRQKETLLKKYVIVMWDVLSRDYNPEIPGEDCYLNVINYASEGSIIVFHDSVKASKNMKYCLPKVLDYYSELGYCFKSIDYNMFKNCL